MESVLAALPVSDRAAAAEATAADSERHRVLSDLAHELRTPLAGVRNYGEILLHCPPEDEAQRRQFLTTILAETDHMNRVLSDLVELERLRLGGAPATEPIELRELVARATMAHYPLAGRKSVEVTLEEMAPGQVYGNGRQLTRAAAALVENAVKFSYPEGTIRVRLSADDERFELAIEDHGIGVAEEHRERIFEPFYRADVPPDELSPRGAGLGLALARAIAASHGGAVRYEAREPGSRFVLTIPK